MPIRALAASLERLSVIIGKSGALILPLLVLTILVNVILRYVFDIGLIELEELQWHLNATVVMCCLAFALQADEHVRVDLLYNRLTSSGRDWVNLLGLVLLFLPFTGLVTWHAWKLAAYSWELKEGSPMPSGLPARYIIKGIMAAGMTLLLLQGIALLLNCLVRLASRRAH
ncbi:TRAP transporter small permease subunit [Marinobacterium sediminicola]|uniref:TRAP transporter small permease protein n=1 Tax=Marinobacterium sediminicola TaxID=518898 RepID=A0ABY1S0S4_9GAMM|nr:TRAP transporter small permease subunit [Marinobacterium sediminicola]ULG68322.1 TRAP transporter small permease subunit [Marinobacterium sediminicola]SMR74805.1 TRAP-type mannitol/chloroaromatic compound transport system, small permease component [Marinobacterium sediminicola]